MSAVSADGSPNILRSSAVVATGTGLSRITGMARVIALATVLGSDVFSDSYFLANTTPNIVYELLIGGVLSATLVPLFVEAQAREDNDAPSALTRLIEMGVEPFITGAAVSAVLAQRLARKLCPHCAEPYEATREELKALHVGDKLVETLTGSTFHRKRGCARCGQTGYRGRIGVFQLLEMTAELEHLAAERAPRDEITRAATANGMRSMWDDGIAKVALGVTTAEELARVCTT